MARRRMIRPQPVEDWPTRFWTRAESSYTGNDLECRGGCNGTGLVTRRRVCPRCRGSGLLVPRRTPARTRDLMPGEPAWTGVPSEELVWPLPWVWEVLLLSVMGPRDLYYADADVLAFVDRGRLCLGLFRMESDAERWLEEVYRYAAGARATGPKFMMPV